MLKIVRTSSPSNPQLGILYYKDSPLSLTLELPYKENQSNISCIPTGIHKCIKVHDRILPNGIKIPVTYEVRVDGRSGILFHSGNTIDDTRGCILLGLGVSRYWSNGYTVSESRNAIRKFIEVVKESEIDLEIVSLV